MADDRLDLVQVDLEAFGAVDAVVRAPVLDDELGVVAVLLLEPLHHELDLLAADEDEHDPAGLDDPVVIPHLGPESLGGAHAPPAPRRSWSEPSKPNTGA